MRNAPPPEIVDFLRGEASLVESIRAAILRTVRGFQFASEDLIEELAQETLSRVYLNLHQGQFRAEAALRTYVQRVAKYVCLEHLRRARIPAEIDLESIPSSERLGPEEQLLRAEERRIARRALAAMSSECRRLFHLIFIEGLTYREIADRIGITETAVKVRVHRCRRPYREGAEPATRSEARSAMLGLLPDDQKAR
jgi:RNA polymerase sigma factor (sigma-70 family)